MKSVPMFLVVCMVVIVLGGIVFIVSGDNKIQIISLIAIVSAAFSAMAKLLPEAFKSTIFGTKSDE